MIIEEEEKIMNDQPSSQPFNPTELVSLPSYVTDIQQGMLPCDEEILTFMEEDHQQQVHRNMVLNEAYMDEMEEMLDTMPCSQPGFDPDDLLTPVLTHNDDHTSILAYVPLVLKVLVHTQVYLVTLFKRPLFRMIQMDMMVLLS